MPMTIVLSIHQLLRRRPVTVSLPVSMVQPRVLVAVSLGEKPKKIKFVVCVATEHLDITLMQFRASLVKLSFGAMLSKEWYVAVVCCS